MEENKDKYYVSSTGTITKIKDLDTTHIINSIAKKEREIFSATNKDDFNNRLNEINDLKEEYHSRLNTFQDGLNNE